MFLLYDRSSDYFYWVFHDLDLPLRRDGTIALTLNRLCTHTHRHNIVSTWMYNLTIEKLTHSEAQSQQSAALSQGGIPRFRH